LLLALYLAIFAVAYYVSVRVGLAFRFQGSQIGVIWPANAVLVVGLLLVSPRHWWPVLVATAIAHTAARATTIPAWRIAWQILGNSAFAVATVVALRRWTRLPLRFDSRREVFVYTVLSFLMPAVFAPTAPAFVRSLLGLEPAYGIDAALLRVTLSSATALLLVAPPLLLWLPLGRPRLSDLSARRAAEAAGLALTLLTVGLVAFGTGPQIARYPSLLVGIIPPLLWAAVRFGPQGACTALLGVAALSIWGTAHQLGPFVVTASADQVLSLQLFWIALGPPVMLLAALIREREQTEDALRRSEERFAKAFHANPYAAAIIRQADGHVLEVNERFESMMKWTRQDMLDRAITRAAFVSDEAAHRWRDVVAARDGSLDVELPMIDRAGTLHEVLLSTEAVDLGGEPCVMATFRDVTDQRRAERETRNQRDQLAHVTRVATVGELSGTLAHELRQPLTTILANAQAAIRVLSQKSPDLAAVREMLEDIAQQDTQADGVIVRLRALLRHEQSAPEAVALEPVLRDALALAHGAVSIAGVEVQLELPASLPRVRADPVQLLQVLLNLLVNACEAMNERPTPERRLHLRAAYREGERVEVIVADRGVGLPRGGEDRVFEPFFTTKEKGLGLGLAICRSIATAHGGQLWAENNPEGGATFHLILPTDLQPTKGAA
jgi:PAS domain S-box-containing protein